jgi:hypothetical protein
MKKLIHSFLRASLAASLLSIAPLAAAQEFERGPARARDVIALQDDLVLLDQSLASVPRRHARRAEFDRRAEELRSDVSALAERMRRDEPGRADGVGATRSEIDAVRQDIAVLRDDVEEATAPGRRGETTAVIPAGTEIEIRLEQGVSSRYSNVEEPVSASTITAIRSNRRTLIPAGATVSGVIRDVRSHDRGQQDGTLRLDFHSITPDGESRIDIRSHVVAVSGARTEGGDTKRNSGLGAILGGVLGGIIDGKKGALIGAVVGAGSGALVTKGEDMELPEGSILRIRLDRSITVPRRARFGSVGR